MRSCDGKASSGSYKAVEKFGNLLNIQYASKSLTGQKHDMHDHAIETTLTKRICLIQNILEHSNTEICDAGEDCFIDNVTYNDDDDIVDDEHNTEIAQNYDLNGFDNNIIFDLDDDGDNFLENEEIDLMSVKSVCPMEHLMNISSKSLLLYQGSVAKDKGDGTLPLHIIAAVELLALLRCSGASLNLYEKIVVWLEKQIPHSLSEALPSREKIVKMFETRHHLRCMSPIPTSVTLPSINLPIEIPVNPLLGCIYSLLSDETLMTSENLICPDMNDLSVISPFNEFMEKVILDWHITLLNKLCIILAMRFQFL